LKAIGDSDCIGSINYFNGRLWGSFLIKAEETERFRNVENNNQYVNFNVLDSDNESDLIEKCPEDWAKAH